MGYSQIDDAMSREMGSQGGFWGLCSRASWVGEGRVVPLNMSIYAMTRTVPGQ